jgi:SAM-dependent methyltransferase
MSESALERLQPHIAILQCPRCGGSLEQRAETLLCGDCGQPFPVEDDIPQLFWPTEDSEAADLTEVVKAFYEETPFPDYDEFDSVASLAQKARRGIFSRMLDQQLPAGIRIIECGCGTGQLSNFLSIANRSVFGTDMCMNSLRLGRDFAARHQLERVHFLQQNLLRPAFRPGSFDLVICNGVLMTLSDPLAGFQSIARLVRPGGYILIGLYHRYGRLGTDARRILFRLTGDRFQFLDPVLRSDASAAKKRAWLADQYRHPHEVKHTIGQVLPWLSANGFTFVKSIPRTRPFRPITDADRLFEPEAPGNLLERSLVELSQALRGSREGGFFTVIGRRQAGEPAG